MIAFGVSELILSLSIILVLSVTALIAGRIAREKGRNEMMWTVMGFLFGFIGVGIIAVLPEDSYPSDATQPVGSTTQ